MSTSLNCNRIKPIGKGKYGVVIPCKLEESPNSKMNSSLQNEYLKNVKLIPSETHIVKIFKDKRKYLEELSNQEYLIEKLERYGEQIKNYYVLYTNFGNFLEKREFYIEYPRAREDLHSFVNSDKQLQTLYPVKNLIEAVLILNINNIYHGDIKLENILVMEEKKNPFSTITFKLCDLDIKKVGNTITSTGTMTRSYIPGIYSYKGQKQMERRYNTLFREKLKKSVRRDNNNQLASNYQNISEENRVIFIHDIIMDNYGYFSLAINKLNKFRKNTSGENYNKITNIKNIKATKKEIFEKVSAIYLHFVNYFVDLKVKNITNLDSYALSKVINYLERYSKRNLNKEKPSIILKGLPLEKMPHSSSILSLVSLFIYRKYATLPKSARFGSVYKTSALPSIIDLVAFWNTIVYLFAKNEHVDDYNSLYIIREILLP